MYSRKRRFRSRNSGPLGPPFTVGNATLGVDYTITTSGGRTFYNFLATGKTMTLTTTASLAIDYFAIGGGGGGGLFVGGGGGGGGLQRATGYSLPAGAYNIVIGEGGTSATQVALNIGNTSGPYAGTNGGNTVFGSIATALGGGGGGSSQYGNGQPGGCGGGGSYDGIAGDGSQGFNGGARKTLAGGGGGGVLANGSGGNGGLGITYNGNQYGGGGGGGGYLSNPGGSGSFGGGNGGSTSGSNGSNGIANTGGGGGGGGSSQTSSGGSGGSGILIISYPPAPFSPSSLDKLSAWFDAADASTVLFSSGSNVSQWNDKSGNNRNLTPNSGTTTYVSNSIRLNTSGMSVTSSVNLSSFSFFMAGLSPNNVSNQTLFVGRPSGNDAYNSTDGFSVYIDANLNRAKYYGNYLVGSQNIINTSVVTTSPFLISFTGASSGALSSWQNGTAGGTASTGSRGTSGNGFGIGGEWGNGIYANFISSAHYYEIIVFSALLTDSQRQQVEGYLAWKWGLQTSLPTNHPYYNSSP